MSDSTLTYQTVHSKPSIPRSVIRWYWGLSIIAAILVLLAGLLDLWTMRVVLFTSVDSMMTHLLVTVVAAVAFLVLLVMWIRRITRYHERPTSRVLAILPMLLIAGLYATNVVLDAKRVPFHIAFAHSRSELERVAAEVRADPARGSTRYTAGVFRIKRVRIEGTQAQLWIEGAESFDYEGALLWSTDATPARRAMRRTSLGGGWFYEWW